MLYRNQLLNASDGLFEKKVLVKIHTAKKGEDEDTHSQNQSPASFENTSGMPCDMVMI